MIPIKINRLIWAIMAPALVFIFCIILSQTVLFKLNSPLLSKAITIDLLISAPLLYYIFIRKTQVSKTSILLVILAGFFIAKLFLPANSQYFLDGIKIIGIEVIEIFLIILLIFRIRKAIKKQKEGPNRQPDFNHILHDVCREILPKGVAEIFASEISVLYYGLFCWRKKIPSTNEFTYHKKTGSISFLSAIIFLAFIEVFALHMLAARWSTTIAWVLTAIGMYTTIQFLGIIRSITKRLIIISNHQLTVRYGIWKEAIIELENISAVSLSKKIPELAPQPILPLSLLSKLEGHSIIITLKNENQMRGLYGIKRNFKTLLLHVDDKDRFVELLNSKIEK